MNNDELKSRSDLKALYERYPWAWVAQLQTVDTGNWINKPYPIWMEHFNYRLKPKLPADLPEPTKDMMNRAVYLGKQIKIPEEWRRAGLGFNGWRPLLQDGNWEYGSALVDLVPGRPYCIDINDPNADEIIALNRAEAKKQEKFFPEDVFAHTESPLANLVQSVLDDRVQYLLSVDERNVRKALIALGWTPPGESEWLRLDECIFELLTEDGALYTADPAPDTVGMWLIKRGPASVRLKRHWRL